MSLSRPVALPATAPTSVRTRAWTGMNALDLALVLGLVAAGLALRLPYLWTVPRFTDETREVLRAVQLMRGEVRGLEVLVNLDAYIGGLYNWLLAGLFWLTGPSPYTPRLVVAVAGALTVGATYLLARDVAAGAWRGPATDGEPVPSAGAGQARDGRVAGVVAAGLLATAGGHILSNGHIAWSHCLTPLFTTLAAWLLVRGARDASAVALLGSGLAFGLALQTHPATLVLLPGAAVYVLWWGRRSLRTPWPYAALGLFLVGISNLVVYNVLTGGNTLTEASDVRDRYAQGRSILMDAGTYAATQGVHGTMLLSYLGGAVDARGPVDSRGMPRSLSPYLLDPTLWVYGGLSLAGLVFAARRGAPLLLLMTVSSVLIMPYFNERKYVPISDGRYLMPLLPLAYAGIGLLAAAAWRAIEERGTALRGTWAVAVALLVAWPLVPLARYYGQELAAGRTNGPLWDVVERVAAARRPGEAVLLDRDLADVKLEGGGTAFRSIRFLLTTSGIDDRSFDDADDYASKMAPDTTALVIADASAFGGFDAVSGRLQLDRAPHGIRGAVVAAPPGPDGYGVYRLTGPGQVGGTSQSPPRQPETPIAPASSAAAGPRGLTTYAVPMGAPSAAAPSEAAPGNPSGGGSTELQQATGKPAEGVRVEVFATGFVNPRGIAFRSDGSMFVAEAGNGGEQSVEVGREKPHQIGKTGQITRVSPGGTRYSMAYGIPSIVTAVGEEVGPSALTFIDDTLYVLTASGGWDVGDPSYNSGIFRLTPDGSLDKVFDYTEYVKANPSRSRREDPRADVPFGMPYGLAALGGKLYTTDGNQEQVFEVDPATGAIRLVAEYPKSNRALTGVTAGPDGALYVAEFAANKVTRVGLDGQITDAATKLRTPIAVAFDPAGAMYVLEYTGRLLRAAPVGEEQKDVLIEGLNKPTAMAFDPDGNLYVSVNGHAAARGEGQIVRVKLVPDPPGHELRYIPVVLSWTIGLGLFAVFMAVGWRNRQRRGMDSR